MGASTLISLEEYLNTSYEPDMDYVDGVLVRRNVGTQLHSFLQSILVMFFGQFQKSHAIKVAPEGRLLVNAATGRHRIPDVMVLTLPYQKGKVVTDVPAVIVEIQSPDDTLNDVVDRCIDYEALGVPHILIMDPETDRAWRFTERTIALIGAESIPLDLPNGKSLEFPISRIFAELHEE